jgi:hypothetical protein
MRRAKARDRFREQLLWPEVIAHLIDDAQLAVWRLARESCAAASRTSPDWLVRGKPSTTPD